MPPHESKIYTFDCRSPPWSWCSNEPSTWSVRDGKWLQPYMRKKWVPQHTLMSHWTQECYRLAGHARTNQMTLNESAQAFVEYKETTYSYHVCCWCVGGLDGNMLTAEADAEYLCQSFMSQHRQHEMRTTSMTTTKRRNDEWNWNIVEINLNCIRWRSWFRWRKISCEIFRHNGWRGMRKGFFHAQIDARDTN